MRVNTTISFEQAQEIYWNYLNAQIDMSFSLTPSKRPYDRSPRERNGKGKWPKNQSVKSLPAGTFLRILCPTSKIGNVIGKGGTNISEIRQETSAKVKVEDILPGCDERVIIISGSNKETEVTATQSKEDDEETTEAEEGDGTKENGEDDEDKEPDSVEGSKCEKGTSSVLKALFLIFERMVEGETEMDSGDEEGNKSTFVVRLLVLSTQVGCLMGKGGSVIKHMASESGAQIRILPRDKLPPCASGSDELVQITGGLDAVRKALQAVSEQLLENPPRDHDSSPANLIVPSSNSLGHSRAEVLPQSNRPFHAQEAPFAAGPRDGADYRSTVPLPKYQESGRMKPSEDILTYRLLCPEEKVGGIIGKGGTVVKTLQNETGCEIKVLDGVSEPEDRMIVISGPAHPDDRISAPQDAVLRVQTRIARALPDIMEKNVIARIIVSANQIGCIIGKGGAIIAEMRKFTGAYIRIMGKDQIPKSLSENEEVIQMNGEFEAVQEALLQITARLREHFFRDTFPSVHYPPNPSFQDQVPPFHYYRGRREHSPPGMYSNRGPPFHSFDSGGGMPPHGGFYPHDDRSPFMHNIHRPGIPPHISGRKPSSVPWGPQGPVDAGRPMSFSDYAGAPQRRIPGFGGGSQSAIITNTTVEVVVPGSIVPSIYGEDGGCLKQIRQISDAKITITEPKPGATETAIIISGTPEQTHAAQSLIQAFVMSEAEPT